MTRCTALIDLGRPSRTERVRDFQPPYRTVYVYVCGSCGATHRMRANSFRGKAPVPGRGAIACGAETVEVRRPEWDPRVRPIRMCREAARAAVATDRYVYAEVPDVLR